MLLVKPIFVWTAPQRNFNQVTIIQKLCYLVHTPCYGSINQVPGQPHNGGAVPELQRLVSRTLPTSPGAVGRILPLTLGGAAGNNGQNNNNGSKNSNSSNNNHNPNNNNNKRRSNTSKIVMTIFITILITITTTAIVRVVIRIPSTAITTMITAVITTISTLWSNNNNKNKNNYLRALTM